MIYHIFKNEYHDITSDERKLIQQYFQFVFKKTCLDN
jgi:hypothetical protein